MTNADHFLEVFYARKNDYPRWTGKQYEPQKGQTITADLLQKHIDGEIVLGSYAIDPDTQMCKWCCWDFDDHSDDGEDLLGQAIDLCNVIGALGVGEPVMEHSGRGIHVWVFFDEPLPAADLVNWNPSPREVEFFPKQRRIAAGGFGNLIRVPGKHPKLKDVWSRAWDFQTGEWLPWSDSVEIFADPPLTDAATIPQAPSGLPDEVFGLEPLPTSAGELEADRGRLERLLELVPVERVTDYDDWFRLGCIIKRYHPTGLDGLALWDKASQRASNYDQAACMEKWVTIDPRADGPGLGTVVAWTDGVQSAAAEKIGKAIEDGDGGSIALVNEVLVGGELVRVVKTGKSSGFTVYSAVFVIDDAEERVGLGNYGAFSKFLTWAGAFCDQFGRRLKIAGENQKERATNWDNALTLIISNIEHEDTDESTTSVFRDFLNAYLLSGLGDRCWEVVRERVPHIHKGEVYVNSGHFDAFLLSTSRKLPNGMRVAQCMKLLGAVKRSVSARASDGQEPPLVNARYWAITKDDLGS